MPRYAEPESMTPFAQVLVDYMWNERPRNRPPMGPAQLAVRLGVHKQNVTNWIFRGSVPPLENVLIILAKLDIPLSTLYNAYKNAGLTVPRFDPNDTTSPVLSASSPSLQPETHRKHRQTRVPVEDLTESVQSAPISPESVAPSPRPYVTPPPLDHAAELAAEWDTIIAQTAKDLRAAHLPEKSVQAVIASLRARQAGDNPRERAIKAEHDPQPESTSEPGSEPGQPPATSNTPPKRTVSTH